PAARPPTSAPARAPALAQKRPPSGKLTFKEREELRGIEQAILTAEAAMVSLQDQLNDPLVYKERALEVPQLVRALDLARLEVDRLYARWQVLEARSPV